VKGWEKATVLRHPFENVGQCSAVAQPAFTLV
jgi:hypothetical protein